MSFFEDMFEGFQRRGHGHHHDHGHHDHEGEHDHEGYDHCRRPAHDGYAPPAFAAPQPTTCTRCHAVLPVMPAMHFCPNCGGALATEPLCSSCGARLGPGAAFCQGCGAKAR